VNGCNPDAVPPPPAQRAERSLLSFSMPRWLKILIACALLAALAAGIDWSSLPQHLSRMDWRMGALALAAIVAELLVNASKWSWSLRLHDLRFPWVYLLRTGCYAFFFNNFLPSAIGGDVYRIYRTLPPDGDRSRAVSAVLVERVAGLIVMLFNGVIGAVLLAATSELARTYLALAAIGTSAAFIVGVMLYLGWLDALAHRLSKLSWLDPVRSNLQRIARARPEWVPLLVTSFLFQILAVAVVWLAFAAIGAPITVAAALLITAAAGIASVLPISISGLGVVEGSIAGTAVALGTSYDSAVLAAIVVRLLVLPISGACGLLYLTERGSRRDASLAITR
jgi:glycosyltransferase 2 family protein